MMFLAVNKHEKDSKLNNKDGGKGHGSDGTDSGGKDHDNKDIGSKKTDRFPDIAGLDAAALYSLVFPLWW